METMPVLSLGGGDETTSPNVKNLGLRRERNKMPGHYTIFEALLVGPVVFVAMSAAVVYGSLLFRRAE
jgi:hypothetical protein